METPYASLDRPQQHATEQLNEICLDTPTNRPRSVCFGFGFSKPTDFWVKSRKTDRDNFHVRFTTLALTQFMRGSHCTCFFLNSLLVFKCKTPSSCNRATASTSTVVQAYRPEFLQSRISSSICSSLCRLNQRRNRNLLGEKQHTGTSSW